MALAGNGTRLSLMLVDERMRVSRHDEGAVVKEGERGAIYLVPW